MKNWMFAMLMMVSGSALAAAPTITSFNPTSGDYGTVITITGTNFDDDTRVFFGSTPEEYLFFGDTISKLGAESDEVFLISPTQLTATLPVAAGEIAAVISVINNSNFASSSNTFIVTVGSGSPDPTPSPPPPPAPPASSQSEPATPVPVNTTWALVLMTFALMLLGGVAIRRFS